jgi:hypothetical protein
MPSYPLLEDKAKRTEKGVLSDIGGLRDMPSYPLLVSRVFRPFETLAVITVI